MTIRQRLEHAIASLKSAGVINAERDARILLAHVRGCDVGRISLILSDPDDWTQAQSDQFENSLIQRQQGKPVSKIIGRKSFWKADFWVTEDVLDPRPDTETLVELALQTPFRHVLDLGTGSGCIVISLLLDQPGATGLGVDVSDAALAVAQENARRLDCKGVNFQRSDWFSAVSGTFDLIVSNPPYIAAPEMRDLDPTVALYDPVISLTDHGDGLTAYRVIAQNCQKFLEPGGRVLVEIGPTQGAAVMEMFRQAGLQGVSITRDLDGRDRVVCGKAP